MIQARTITLSQGATPNTVQARPGDIVAFHAANADVVVCFDRAAFFGAYRYAIARGTTLPLVVQGHAPLAATRYSIKFGDLTAECFPRSLVEGELQIVSVVAPQPDLTPKPDPASQPISTPAPSPVIQTTGRVVEIRAGQDPPALNNLTPGEQVTFHAVDTVAALCFPVAYFGDARVELLLGAQQTLTVQPSAPPGPFGYQLLFNLTDPCDRGEDGGGSVGGGSGGGPG